MQKNFLKLILLKKVKEGRGTMKKISKKIKRNRDEKAKLGVNKANISVALIFLSKGLQFSLLVLKVVHNKEIRE